MYLIIEIIIVIFIIIATYAINMRRKQRTAEALSALEEGRDANVQDGFTRIASASYTFAHGMYWVALVVAVIVAIASVQFYTRVQEPDASMIEYLAMPVAFYGLVIISLMISVSFLVAGAYQHHALSVFLSRQKNQTAMTKAQDVLLPRIGEIGVSLFAFAAVIGSLLIGAGVLALLFMASQTAIECARSAKCM